GRRETCCGSRVPPRAKRLRADQGREARCQEELNPNGRRKPQGARRPPRHFTKRLPSRLSPNPPPGQRANVPQRASKRRQNLAKAVPAKSTSSSRDRQPALLMSRA